MLSLLLPCKLPLQEQSIRPVYDYTGLKITQSTHINCRSAQCFCCDAYCKIPIQIYVFLIELPLNRRKLLRPSKSEVQGLILKAVDTIGNYSK